MKRALVSGIHARAVAAALATVLPLLAMPAWAQGDGRPQNLPTVSLRAGLYNITAQVARTQEQRAIGLMYRREMPSHEGMLFVFEEAGVQCFWMRNTPLPLDAAFVADDGRIVNIASMQPHSEQSHCSEKPVRYVLEMNQGWFAKRGLKPGSALSGSPFKP